MRSRHRRCAPVDFNLNARYEHCHRMLNEVSAHQSCWLPEQAAVFPRQLLSTAPSRGFLLKTLLPSTTPISHAIEAPQEAHDVVA